MSKTAAIPMDKEIQSFQFIFTGQQYKKNFYTTAIFLKQKYQNKKTHTSKTCVSLISFISSYLFIFSPSLNVNIVKFDITEC